MSPAAESPFPWHLGVFDAHCHPTDTPSSIQCIPNMKTRALTIMATRSQDQHLVSETALKMGVKSADPGSWEREECVVPAFGWHPWFSYQMYLSPENQNQNEDKDGDEDEETPYSNHPPDEEEELKPLTGDAKISHYHSILSPSHNPPTPQDLQIYNTLPDPQPFSTFLAQTRAYLQKHPYALIGEIGLDRSFRIPEPYSSTTSSSKEKHENEKEKGESDITPGTRSGRPLTPLRVSLSHQKALLKAQLNLAAEMHRAVSLHGVQAHGALFDILQEMWKGHEKPVLSKRERKKRGADSANTPTEDESAQHDEKVVNKGEKEMPYPPRICLHSYSGPASMLKQYTHPSIPIQIFTSFSTAINLSTSTSPPSEIPQAFVEVIQAVPEHMLLVESDLHTAGEAMDRRMEEIVRVVCGIRGWGLEDGVRILGANWRRFVFG